MTEMRLHSTYSAGFELVYFGFASSLFSLSMIYKIPINCAFIVFDAPFDPTYFMVQGLAQQYFPVH
jgi:hypothetical protein